MSKTQYLKIPKTLNYRIHELIQSLSIIYDCLKLYKNGKSHHFIPIFGQLRSLLIEKSKKNKPLLIDIANILKIELKLYILKIELPNNLKYLEDNIAFSISGSPFTLKKELENQIEISMGKFLDYPMVNFNKKSISVKEILSYLANNIGGSHYSPSLPKDFIDILFLKLNNTPILYNFIEQLTRIVLEIGIDLLKKITDFEIHITIFIPSQKLELNDMYILDYKYVQSNMRISVGLNKNKELFFRITDDYQKTVEITSEIQFDEYLYLSFSISILDSLKTKIAIYKNDQILSEKIVNKLIEIKNDINSYDRFVNKEVSDKSSSIIFGLLNQIALSKSLDNKEREELNLYILEKYFINDQELLFFNTKNYGYSKSGEVDLKIIGEKKYYKISEYYENLIGN